jgi:hypothetical protein
VLLLPDSEPSFVVPPLDVEVSLPVPFKDVSEPVLVLVLVPVEVSEPPPSSPVLEGQ